MGHLPRALWRATGAVDAVSTEICSSPSSSDHRDESQVATLAALIIVGYSLQTSLNAEEGLYWFHLMRAVRQCAERGARLMAATVGKELAQVVLLLRLDRD